MIFARQALRHLLHAAYCSGTYPAVAADVESFYEGLNRVRSHELNAGLQAGLLGDRFTFAVNYYDKVSDDGLDLFCFGKQYSNSAVWHYDARKQVMGISSSIANRGFEFDLKAGILSSRNIKWQDWKSAIENAVNASNQGGSGNGWFSYFSSRGRDTYVVMSRASANSHAQSAFNALARACQGAAERPSWTPDNKYTHGLVVQWGKRIVGGAAVDDYSRVSISFRLARRSGALMTAPLYYTEVHFQGDQEDMPQ